ncbi:uncharacterized protein LOC111270118 isoform X2 [Varroa jacobsoni]|uniref:Uncharacterized protein n=1 Tax=Varroa destructor TaxID=109461 RepID=A0A7M7L1P6_VARDE|nr:uncharacterized protein LOC111255117 isoform X2 [Varroa destructor]XP_022705903.1 uncharacterized protein LOC111270118 isoform X2 [Varroa jacobsoni]
MAIQWGLVCAFLVVILLISSETSAMFISDVKEEVKKPCRFPGTPWHGKVEPLISPANKREFPHKTNVSYSCDPGYTLVGMKKRQCDNGKWRNPVPKCLRNMALEKPVFFDTDYTHASYAVDHDENSCVASKTKHAKYTMIVDLIEPTTVKLITVLFGEPAFNVSVMIRVGSHYPNTSKICGHKILDIVPGLPNYFSCRDNPVGRHVSVQVTHSKDIVNFCNLQVLSESALAAQDVCSNQNDNLNTTIGSFGTRCIKVFRQRVATIEEARSVCKNIAGHLLEQMDKNLQDYVNWHLATHFAEEKNTSAWLGARRDKNASLGWSWFSGEPVISDDILEDKGFGLSYDCLTMEGEVWKVQKCIGSHYAVCIHDLRTCGTPPMPEGAAIMHQNGQVPVNQISKVFCGESYYLDGDEVRCFGNGSISQKEPACLPFNCSLTMEDGTIARLDGSNRANFSCNPGFILASPSNESELRCIDRHWTPQTPLCLEETSPTTNKGFEDVHRVGDILQEEISILSRIPAFIMDLDILSVITGATIITIVIGLSVYLVYNRRRATTGEVILSKSSVRTGAL